MYTKFLQVERVAGFITLHGFSSPKYDMDAYMAMLLGGEDHFY